MFVTSVSIAAIALVTFANILGFGVAKWIGNIGGNRGSGVEKRAGLKFFAELDVGSATRRVELPYLGEEFPGLGCGR